MVGALIIAVASATVGPTSTVTHTGTISNGLTNPGRLAAGPFGSLLVADQAADAVLEYSTAGGGVLVATHPVADPVGVALLPDLRIFIAHGDGSLNVYDAGFVLIGPVDPTPLTMVAPNDLAFDGVTGELYAVDSYGDQILVFAESAPGANDWALVRAWGVEGAGLSEFETPQAIAVGGGQVIVTDTDNYRVQVFTTSGMLVRKFGYRILFLPGSAEGWFARSEGLALDSCGNIYVSDALFGTVRAFDPLGVELDPAHLPVVAYGANPGDVRVPMDITISGGVLYVVSAANGAVETYDVACTMAAMGSAASVSGTLDTPRSTKRVRRVSPPDNPSDIALAIRAGRFSPSLDLNMDREVDAADLEMAVSQFGVGSVDSFLGGDVATTNFTAPHVLDLTVACGRCHHNNTPEGGLLTAGGQANVCASCHTSGGIAGNMVVDVNRGDNSHAWGVAAVNPTYHSMGPDPASASEMALHLDGGDIRCGTCHNQHGDDYGSPYLRWPTDMGKLCMECHRGADAPTNHAEGMAHGPEYCTDCHDMHADNNNYALTKASMYSWYINGFAGGMVTTGFTDNTIGVGNGGFVDPDADEFGLCDVCHPYFDDSQVPPVPSAEFLALSVPHDAAMPACTTCHKHHNAFLPGLGQGLAAGEYVGADTCAQCHVGPHGTWTSTIHASALANITPFANTNPACLPCHTVGFGLPSGFVDEATTPHLAGVQCENCHGPGSDHVNAAHTTNIAIDKTSELCGNCHTDSHHPTIDEWTTSGHATASGNAHYGSCNACHKPLGDDPNTGLHLDVECVACHNSHAQTGNDTVPNPPHDSQLLHPETASPIPSNVITDATDPARFNLCGQCHHSRGRVWTATSRGPHHSLQANVYLGEMPMPVGEEATPLAPNTVSDHAGLALQCNTCHMYKAAHQDGPPEVDAITGHSWHVNYEACAGCHGSAAAAQALTTAIQGTVHARLDAIKAAMGDPSLWEYSCCGGPADQTTVSDTLKQVRFLVAYVEGDASYGIHNGPYTDEMLTAAETLMALPALSATYLGADVCSACHTTKHADWTGTQHSQALVNITPFANTNPVCLGCHTVGFGTVGGFVDEATTPHLAGVQCENCHGPSSTHVLRPWDTSLQPVVDKTAELCGACHTDSHHPTYDEWGTSLHANSAVDAHGISYCFPCHAPLSAAGDPVLLDVECAACHDSHKQTGNDEIPNPPHDSQLWHPEVANPTPSNVITDATDGARFNLCGQCHHSRGRVWTATDRGPHHSLQANVLLGEMPMPVGEEGTPLVANLTGTHESAQIQCVTCHMETAPHQDGPPEVPANTGHTYAMSTGNCSMVGCHVDEPTAIAALAARQATTQAGIDDITTRLGDPLTWEYSCCGGPPEAVDCAADPLCLVSQDDILDDIKKIRFLLKYVEGDASLGAHNPIYVAAIIAEARAILTSLGM